MNLSAYDNVEETFNKGTWIEPFYKKLYSNEITYRPYCTFLKRYNNKTKNYDYYIAMLDDYDNNTQVQGVIQQNNNMIKLNISSIWNVSKIKNIKVKTQINVEHIEHTDDGDIYYLDI